MCQHVLILTRSIMAPTCVRIGVGTLLWLSPEIHDGQRYSLSSDVYSFGIVLWEIASRLQPWMDKKTSWQITDSVLAGERPPLDACRPAPEEYIALMQLCWKQDADERPSFGECLSQLERLQQEEANTAV
eukprot:TRINITY_DN11035_c0_g1_i1.p1 TRINITY_DN11035_c0_g1~~TRINITY_DN11035_c0_g1_i1.p1  ORF type:complete len:130 (+),score=15.57 TRINITY_DN11035_c0_g1_i1:22-411(+)